MKRYEQTGNGLPKTTTTDDNEINILLSVEENSTMYAEAINSPEDISMSSIHRILAEGKVKLDNLMYTQELLENYSDRITEFSEIMMNETNNHPDFEN